MVILMPNKIFYQDFLMDFSKDDNDNPIVELKYLDSMEGFLPISTKYNLFDVVNGMNRFISFQYLHNLLNKDEWDLLFKKCLKCDKVLLIDDIKILNNEVVEMKKFYLKVYYLNLLKYNSCTYIYSLY